MPILLDKTAFFCYTFLVSFQSQFPHNPNSGASREPFHRPFPRHCPLRQQQQVRPGSARQAGSAPRREAGHLRYRGAARRYPEGRRRLRLGELQYQRHQLPDHRGAQHRGRAVGQDRRLPRACAGGAEPDRSSRRQRRRAPSLGTEESAGADEILDLGACSGLGQPRRSRRVRSRAGRGRRWRARRVPPRCCGRRVCARASPLLPALEFGAWNLGFWALVLEPLVPWSVGYTLRFVRSRPSNDGWGSISF